MLDARHWQMLGMLVLDNLEIGNSRARSMLDFFNARPITNSKSGKKWNMAIWNIMVIQKIGEQVCKMGKEELKLFLYAFQSAIWAI